MSEAADQPAEPAPNAEPSPEAPAPAEGEPAPSGEGAPESTPAATEASPEAPAPAGGDSTEPPPSQTPAPAAPAAPPVSSSPGAREPTPTGDNSAEEAFPYNESEPLNGVIAALTHKNNGNPHTKGLLIVTASSTQANQPWQVLDPGWNSHWVSDDEPEQWIRFDFKMGRMLVTHYTLKSYNYVAGGNHLRSWVLQGSTNDIDWLELDRRQSMNDLNDRYRVKTYQCKNPGCYRYLKLTQTGKSHCDSDMLALTGIEFFGTLRND